jgi:hypothetical protein
MELVLGRHLAHDYYFYFRVVTHNEVRRSYKRIRDYERMRRNGFGLRPGTGRYF